MMGTMYVLTVQIGYDFDGWMQLLYVHRVLSWRRMMMVAMHVLTVMSGYISNGWSLL